MISIILVDDHVIMRDGLRHLLDEESDIEVIGEADNGRKAVKLALEKKPDIVIMDIAMQDMNGIEATRQIKSNNPEIKVIALSMHSERQIVVGVFRAGASGYLLKESSSLELVQPHFPLRSKNLILVSAMETKKVMLSSPLIRFNPVPLSLLTLLITRSEGDFQSM